MDASCIVAHPDFPGAGCEIQEALVTHLFPSVGRRHDFDADVGCTDQEAARICRLGESGRCEREVGRLHAIRGVNADLRPDLPVRQARLERRNDPVRALRMREPDGWVHDDLPLPVRFPGTRKPEAQAILDSRLHPWVGYETLRCVHLVDPSLAFTRVIVVPAARRKNRPGQSLPLASPRGSPEPRAREAWVVFIGQLVVVSTTMATRRDTRSVDA